MLTWFGYSVKLAALICLSRMQIMDEWDLWHLWENVNALENSNYWWYSKFTEDGYSDSIILTDGFPKGCNHWIYT